MSDQPTPKPFAPHLAEEQVRVLVESMTPVFDAIRNFGIAILKIPALAALLEADDQLSFDDDPDGCWADVWDETEEDYVSCGDEADDLGLCSDHRKVMSGS